MKRPEIAEPVYPRRPAVITDCRGLSTMEYTVLFVLILLGGLAIFSKLGNSMVGQVGRGGQSFGSTLDSFQRGGEPSTPGGGPATHPATPSVDSPCNACPQQPAAPAQPAAAEPPAATGGTKKQNSI